MQNLRSLRHCLGRFATGVTVITCQSDDGGHCGITANSFTSVSLEPPLILWNIGKASRSLDAFLSAEYFGVNILSEAQEALSVHFARSENDLFASIPHSQSEHGVPRLADTLAWLECRRHAVHDCGDHYIIIGEVVDFAKRDGQPLLFYAGRYGRIERE